MIGGGETIIALAGVFMITSISIVAIKSKARGRFSREDLGRIEEDLHGELDDRMSTLEKRMANIETIVLEREKHEEFDRSL